MGTITIYLWKERGARGASARDWGTATTPYTYDKLWLVLDFEIDADPADAKGKHNTPTPH
eukprot:scaffold34460_cov222-Skeletonema_dohrnii-CCMP3373.AAC.6